MKKCSKCYLEKELNEFYKENRNIHDKTTSRCKSCIDSANKEYASQNSEHIKAYLSNYAKNPINAKRKLEASRRYRLRNRIKLNKQSCEYILNRKKTDPYFRLVLNLRIRLNKALRRNSKCESTISLLGCSVEKLKTHISSKFKPGMTWDNYGDWHIDHKLPCSSFDLTKPDEQRRCFNYENLQPLWAKENLQKADKIL